MRNVQQWKRDLDNSVIRVFLFGGIAKTVSAFLENSGYNVGNPKGINGIFIHNRKDVAEEGTGAVKGNYILRRTSDNEITVLADEQALFQHMAKLGYRYIGNERVRTMILTEDIDTGLIHRWGAWADSIRIDEPGKIYPQRDSVEDSPTVVSVPDVTGVIIGSKGPKEPQPDPEVETKPQACGDSIAPEGWECTRAEGHEGPCAAVRKDAPEPYQYQKRDENGFRPKKPEEPQSLWSWLVSLFRR